MDDVTGGGDDDDDDEEEEDGPVVVGNDRMDSYNCMNSGNGWTNRKSGDVWVDLGSNIAIGGVWIRTIPIYP